ncbi:hypothetical protein MM221_10855 [Salipaludibacillus sp. LMS25]|uniref:hypothetical protein n=1 Tax=Salipaludibacillus sp. LMS25 TaxID=2924031 RepID=UPI0020D03EA8|nr:hypothetical protein [Salipaludibacillus sp. LMS25]UTR13157.1 hypothetical protein MM221_10855 [Salipaludibacillus sp. LMS25]
MSEKYKLGLNMSSKVVEMEVKGTFSPTDVENFVSDYQKIVGKINPTEYILDIDCSKLDILQQEMVPSMEGAFTMYKESGFKKVILNVKSSVLKMQLSRLARNTKLTTAEVVEI